MGESAAVKINFGFIPEHIRQRLISDFVHIACEATLGI